MYMYIHMCRSMCLKDQLSEVLPALLQITHGLEECNLLEIMRISPAVWQPVFDVGNSFEVTAEDFLCEVDAQYSTSQIKKIKEVDTFKFFCDAIEHLDDGM